MTFVITKNKFLGIVSKAFCSEALFPTWNFSRSIRECAEQTLETVINSLMKQKWPKLHRRR